MTLRYETSTIEPQPIHFMSAQQMQAEKGNELLFDIECYPNFFLLGFKSYQTGLVKFFEQSNEQDIDLQSLHWLVHSCTLIGFNLTGYDLPMLWAALAGKNCGQLYEISRKLTEKKKNQYGKRIKVKPWQVLKKFGIHNGRCNSIDIQTVAPALPQELSLKHYGARMHVDRLQELPVDFTEDLSYEQARAIRLYNVNDLDVTGWLRHSLTSDIELRKQMSETYSINLLSRSDAQIAERVMAAEIKQQTGIDIYTLISDAQERWAPGTKFKYKNPKYIQFYTPVLRELHNTIVNQEFGIMTTGKVGLVQKGFVLEKAKWSVRVGDTTYTVGIGGLHSTEKSQTFFSDQNYQIFDRDVASYYPAIILNQGLYPQHIGSAFLEVYESIVTRRLEAKREGDKATSESLKITINGGFGKLGSKWSVFYSPDLLIQVTITGQLSLLMLIEMLEWSDIPVVSENTDGVVIRCPQGRQDDYLQIVKDWERITGFKTEEKWYQSIHSRDVNNYIAIVDQKDPELLESISKGKKISDSDLIKAKGAYTNRLSFKNPAREMLMSNPTAEIVSEAVMLYLKTCKTDNIITVDETICKCKDITKFLFVKRVNGGAVHNGNYIGKVVRWYYQKGQHGDIRNYKPNAAGIRSVVGDSQGGLPLMDLPKKFPKDINYTKYIQRAKNVLEDLGYGPQLELF